MTPKEAAEALIKALPAAVSLSQLADYGIEATTERAMKISREVLSLNLFWICTAIDAHVPQQYRGLIVEAVLQAVESGWSTTYEADPSTWAAFMAEWRDRKRRYERLVQDGAHSLALSTEVALSLEEQRVVSEEERRHVLTMLIDLVPVETYGQLLQDI